MRLAHRQDKARLLDEDGVWVGPSERQRDTWNLPYRGHAGSSWSFPWDMSTLTPLIWFKANSPSQRLWEGWHRRFFARSAVREDHTASMVPTSPWLSRVHRRSIAAYSFSPHVQHRQGQIWPLLHFPHRQDGLRCIADISQKSSFAWRNSGCVYPLHTPRRTPWPSHQNPAGSRCTNG